MSTPRIEINLGSIRSNAKAISAGLNELGIEVLGVTKLVCGDTRISRAICEEGINRLGDSRIKNLQRLSQAGISAELGLLRISHPGEAQEVVKTCSWSMQSQLQTLAALNRAAGDASTSHGVLLMVEMGDLREGALPKELPGLMRFVLGAGSLYLEGIGVNMACFGGILPSQAFLDQFLSLKRSLEGEFQIHFKTVSFGNSAVLSQALSRDLCGLNQVRIGEALFLGREPGTGQPLEGLKTDSFRLIGSVLECLEKSREPYGGKRSKNAFGEVVDFEGTKGKFHVLVDLGRQDTNPSSLKNPEFEIIGGSSDYLVLRSPVKVDLGSEIIFTGNYEAVLRAMVSPFVKKVYKEE